MDKAKAIRTEIKSKLGYNSRQVSVTRSNGCAINVTVKDLSIDIAPIEALVKKYEEISRCQFTYEILSGGNTFVFVQYSWEAKRSAAPAYMELAKKILDKASKLTNNILIPITKNGSFQVYFDKEQKELRVEKCLGTFYEIQGKKYPNTSYSASLAAYNENQLAETLTTFEARFGKITEVF